LPIGVTVTSAPAASHRSRHQASTGSSCPVGAAISMSSMSVSVIELKELTLLFFEFKIEQLESPFATVINILVGTQQEDDTPASHLAKYIERSMLSAAPQREGK
jgi:hypothetical protein